jgi:hypothetical protein
LCAVYVEDGDKFTAWSEHGHDDLADGRAAAGDVAVELFDLRDERRLLGAGGGTTHSAREIDLQAAVATLDGTEEEELMLDQTIESRPVEVLSALFFASTPGRSRPGASPVPKRPYR